MAELAAGRKKALRFGVDDPRLARPALQHAADSKYCVSCGMPYDYAAAYVGHLGDYRVSGLWARPARRSMLPPAQSSWTGSEGSSFDLVTPAGTRRVRLPLPGLYNVYNALAASSLALALEAPLDDIVTGLTRFSCCVRPLRADRERRPQRS